MSNPNSIEDLFTLTPDPRGDYVTWSQGKKQIRSALRIAGWKAVGTFRPRKVARNTFEIKATDPQGNLHTINAERKPGALITRNLITL